MAKNQPKTRPTTASVDDFLNAQEPRRRDDCRWVRETMERITGASACMWGDAIVGFGRYEIPYANGEVLDWPLMGFSPRKQALVLYLMDGYEGREGLLSRLGKHSLGKACLYIKRLSDVDLDVLEAMIQASMEALRPRRID